MRDLILGHGTWGRSALWTMPYSDVTREAEARGFRVHRFCWSGILGGVRALLQPTLLNHGDPDEADIGADQPELLLWLDAGEKLKLFCEARGLVRPCIVSHSHMRQLVIYAAAKGQLFDTVVDVSGPIRADMERARRKGLGNIARWVRFYDPINDLTIREGQLFDGAISLNLVDEHAQENVDTSGSGHSGLVIDAALRAQYRLWEMFAAA